MSRFQNGYEHGLTTMVWQVDVPVGNVGAAALIGPRVEKQAPFSVVLKP
jgi:hypothetical protein